MVGHPHLVVTGPMGVGKSTTTVAVAAALGWAVRDSDADIETVLGVSGRTIASAIGVDELHRLESAVLLGALAVEEPSVISAAASVVDDPRCREALARRAMVVVLGTTIDELVARQQSGDHRRSMSPPEVAALVARREQLFAQVADLSLDGTKSTSDLVSSIVDALD